MKTQSVYSDRQTTTSSPPAEATGPDGAAASAAAPPGRERQRRAHRSALFGALPAVVAGLLVLALWQLLVQLQLVSDLLLPAPAAVLQSLWYSLTDPYGSLFGYAAITLVESVLGCALGALVALPLGYAIAHSRLVARASQPYIAGSQALPAVAIAPLIVLWLGYGLTPVIALCALIVFFPMVVTTVLGLRLLDAELLDAARVAGAGRWALLRYIEAPLALPSLLAGLRVSLTLSVTGAIVGEFVTGGGGLGQLLLEDLNYGNSAGLFATLLALALLAAVLYSVVRLVERRFSYAEVSLV